MTALARLSINHATLRQWSLPVLVDACAGIGIPYVGLWREPVHRIGVARAAKLVRDAGLSISSLCRAGFFPTHDPGKRAWLIADNRRAIDEAATLGTDVLIVVPGGLPDHDHDLAEARRMVLDGLAELVPYAAERGVQLALEPMHPLFCADRGVVSTLASALDMVEQLPPAQTGVTVDAYHVWWDPRLFEELARAGQRILAFQICDWVTPLRENVLFCRGVMGDGCIELRRLREAVDRAGYTGPIEIEIFNQELWKASGDEVLRLLVDRYFAHVR